MEEQIAEAERLQRWGYAAFLHSQAGTLVVDATPPADPIVEAAAPQPDPAPADTPAEPTPE